MTSHTELQPQDGEVVLTCKHVPRGADKNHFFHLEPPPRVKTPAGEYIQPTWIIICDGCNTLYLLEDNESSIHKYIANHCSWVGNDPIIVNGD